MEFYSFIGSFKEDLTSKIHITLLYACNERVRRIDEQNEKSFKGFSKTKKKKKENRHRLSFITLFKIEFLQLFTG